MRLTLLSEAAEVQVVCSWCQKVMGTKQAELGDYAIENGLLISHTICPDCAKLMGDEADKIVDQK